MKISLQEGRIIRFALTTTEQRNPMGQFMSRSFPLEELSKAMRVNEQLEPFFPEEGKKIPEEVDLRLSTHEKALILKLLKREWGVGDGEHVLSIQRKIG